jgi:hypothetical protein
VQTFKFTIVFFVREQHLIVCWLDLYTRRLQQILAQAEQEDKRMMIIRKFDKSSGE